MQIYAENVLFVNFFPKYASYDRLLEIGNNRNAQFNVFHRLSRAISTSLTLVGVGSVLLSGLLCSNSRNDDYTLEVGCVLSASQ
jgi:hypothetical protein